MATVNSKNITLSKEGYRAPAGENITQVLTSYDSYTSDTAMVAADIIKTNIKIPAGAKVLTVKTIVPTNGGTMSVGISGTAAKYVSAATVGVVSTHLLTAATENEEIICTIGGAPSAAGKYEVLVEYIKY